MSNQRIKFPRADDKVIASAFKELGRIYGVAQANVQGVGYVRLGAVDLARQEGDWAALLKSDSTLIESMSMSVAGLTIAYYRGGHDAQKSPIYDEIIFTEHNGGFIAERIEILAYLNRKLGAYEPGRAVAGLSEEQTQALAIHQSTLSRLELLNEELISKGIEFRRALETQFEAKSTANDEHLQRRLDHLEEQFDAKSDVLDQREAALADQLREIDNRNNTIVRREIRDRMLNDVKARIESFGVSRKTSSKRVPVAIGIGLMSLLLASLLVWTVGEISDWKIRDAKFKAASLTEISFNRPEPPEKFGEDKKDLYLLWVRFGLFSFGLLGTLLYYVKWQNKWAEQHAMSEFQLQQFYVDVNRANWVIESCLEWRKETASAIPKDLLVSITNGLFVKSGTEEAERVIHPVDELASALIGSAAKVRLNINGNEVELDKPGKTLKKPFIASAQAADLERQ